jgi:hypothetical protein
MRKYRLLTYPGTCGDDESFVADGLSGVSEQCLLPDVGRDHPFGKNKFDT